MLEIEPIGWVRNTRTEVEDDRWGDVTSSIVLAERFEPDALDGIEEFSHVEIVFLFDRVDPSEVVCGARHPRNNTAWPRVGIFAQRGKKRPNRIGTTIARLAGRSGREVRVVGLDAVDGTPVLDIKPVMAEFLPREPVGQPAWSHEVMREYWSDGAGACDLPRGGTR